MTFGLSARTTHARCSAYVRYGRYGVSHTSDICCVYQHVNCIHTSSLQLISSKQLFAGQSTPLSSRSQLMIDAFCIGNIPVSRCRKVNERSQSSSKRMMRRRMQAVEPKCCCRWCQIMPSTSGVSIRQIAPANSRRRQQRAQGTQTC
jgi:hypothetical protein